MRCPRACEQRGFLRVRRGGQPGISYPVLRCERNLSFGSRDGAGEQTFKNSHFVGGFSHMLARGCNIAIFQIYPLGAQVSVHADISTGNVLAQTFSVSLSLALQALHAGSDSGRPVVEFNLLHTQHL